MASVYFIDFCLQQDVATFVYSSSDGSHFILHHLVRFKSQGYVGHTRGICLQFTYTNLLVYKQKIVGFATLLVVKLLLISRVPQKHPCKAA